jgi:hypothetical protein
MLRFVIFFAKGWFVMQKIFYIAENSGKTSDGIGAPGFDRFQRVSQLNELLGLGWSIKELKNEQDGTYFILEKV